MSFTQVALKPSAGFCVKSTALEPGLLPPPAVSKRIKASANSGGLLEPADQPTPVPKGMKVFVNICYDKNVPAPPEASEEAIQRAIKGANPDESLDEEGLRESEKTDRKDEEEWYVPVVVSEPRVDNDKAGKPSLVVDCVYHSEVRKRTLRDPGFKVFLVELGLQRIEAQTGLTLSRHIGTPNIASKGKLESRTVRIPTALLLNSAKEKDEPLTPAQQAVADLAKSEAGKGTNPNKLDSMGGGSGKGQEDGHKTVGAKAKEKGKKPLIEEIDPTPSLKPEPVQPKSILKSSSATVTSKDLKQGQPATAEQKERERDLLIPLDVSWNWEKLEDSGKLRVTINIPDLTASSITAGRTFLDIEPNRIILTLSSPNGETRTVDINRTLSDAQLAVKIKEHARAKVERLHASSKAVALVKEEATKEELEAETMAESEKEVEKMLYLKRQPDFNVDGAKAQWIVKDKKLVITL